MPANEWGNPYDSQAMSFASHLITNQKTKVRSSGVFE